MPAHESSGTTTSSVSVERPGREIRDARRIAVDDRGRTSVEARVAHEHAGRDLHADPALLQDVDREPRLAGDRVAARSRRS